MKNAVFPGSFDPITSGHMEIIKRGSRLFETLTVAVCNNPEKKSLFSLKDRLEMIKNACRDMKNVRVASFEGLLIDFAEENGIDTVLRGLRNARDFDYEKELADIYYDTGRLESVFLPSRGEYSHISSGMVRELIRGNKDISKYIPK